MDNLIIESPFILINIMGGMLIFFIIIAAISSFYVNKKIRNLDENNEL